MRWVRVATAPNEPLAESWAELLRRAGVPAMARRESYLRAYLGPGAAPVEVAAPEDRAEEARRILRETLGEDESRPQP